MSSIPSRRIVVISLLLGLLLLLPAVSQAQEEPVVRAVLFYSPTCPHCHQVINEVLMPMVEEYGQRLQIAAVDVTQAGGQALYQSAIVHFEIPEDRLGVPTLVVGDTVLVGGAEILALFPGIVSQGLSTGIDWPAIPDFVPPAEATEADAQANMTPTPSASPTASATITAEPTAGQEATSAPAASQTTGQASPTPIVQPTTEDMAPPVLDDQGPEIAFEEAEDPPADPVGFVLASAVLAGMIGACLYVVWRVVISVTGRRDFGSIARAAGLSWAVPLIAVLGIGIAAYLAYVEVAQVTAVCGPVGHCNLVQSSAYARILGVPIALIGVASYVAIIALWFIQRLVKEDTLKAAAGVGLIGLTVIGTLFSIYLTVLELFIIQAVCAWCLVSANLMTLLMVMAVESATRKPELAIPE